MAESIHCVVFPGLGESHHSLYEIARSAGIKDVTFIEYRDFGSDSAGWRDKLISQIRELTENEMSTILIGHSFGADLILSLQEWLPESIYTVMFDATVSTSDATLYRAVIGSGKASEKCAIIERFCSQLKHPSNLCELELKAYLAIIPHIAHLALKKVEGNNALVAPGAVDPEKRFFIFTPVSYSRIKLVTRHLKSQFQVLRAGKHFELLTTKHDATIALRKALLILGL